MLGKVRPNTEAIARECTIARITSEPLEVATAQIRLDLSFFAKYHHRRRFAPVFRLECAPGHRETVRMLEAWMTSGNLASTRVLLGSTTTDLPVPQETCPPDWQIGCCRAQ